MSGAVETTTPTNATVDLPRAARADQAVSELDLERLVWDPEYRKAMRPLLRRAD